MSIVWVDEDKAFNIGIKSVLDGKPMDGISSLRIHSGPDMTQVIDFTIIYRVFFLTGPTLNLLSVGR